MTIVKTNARRLKSMNSRKISNYKRNILHTSPRLFETILLSLWIITYLISSLLVEQIAVSFLF